MADTKASRIEKARNAERRQRERELSEALERSDEPEPPREDDPAVDRPTDEISIEVPGDGETVVRPVLEDDIAPELTERYPVEPPDER
ncbi:hypothetical protein [Natrinema marinum]|uniref:hypothetical protein n=1 Tax=Natrinema marinum TaxID=2961598 RepID=UPI0020C85C7A|nr:hypothetical protein [Natrinema marinum]